MERNVKSLLTVLLAVGFLAACAMNISAEEATISGELTPEGTIVTVDGQEYAITGDKAEELHKSIGKKIELKGTVEEKQGKKVIFVKEYKLLPSAVEKAPVSEPAK